MYRHRLTKWALVISGRILRSAVPCDGSAAEESLAEAGSARRRWPAACWAELQQLPTSSSTTWVQTSPAGVQSQADRGLQAQGSTGNHYFRPHHPLRQGARHWRKLQDCVSIIIYYSTIKYISLLDHQLTYARFI